MSTPEPIVRTRFAPSPSGHLHVGGARTALFCWAFARKHGGRFILRVEDTDRKRSSDAAAVGFLEDMQWLGLDWDEGPLHHGIGGGETGPYFSSERLPRYDEAIERLVASGAAYRAFETSEELDAARDAARARNESYRYDRAALRLDAATVERYLAEGRPYIVRFRTDESREILFDDAVRGELRIPAGEIDDFVIRKADGFPTYHLAVVVDDALMDVTHVIRGEEHLYNTPKHVLLQEALGYRRPVYAHLSLIFNPDGSKMSKRDKDKALRLVVRERSLDASPAHPDGSPAVTDREWSWWLESKDHQLDLASAERLAAALDVALPEIHVDDFRRAGYLPEVLSNYLALLGWSPGSDLEKFDRDYLVGAFDFDRVVKSAAKFDRNKLLAFNLDALQALSDEAFVDALRAHCDRYHPDFVERLGPQRFTLFGRANHARSKTLEDPIRSCRFFVDPDDAIVYPDNKATRKALHKGDPSGLDRLRAILPTLEAHDDWTVDGLERTITAWADTNLEGNLGKIAQPIRVAVSGGPVSPAIFDTLAILGRDATLNRIHRCLTQITVH